MADGQIVRFSIGEAFPAHDQLARWMTVCMMAMNDLIVVNRLLTPRLEGEIPAQSGENFYLGRVAASHLYEAATFLRRSDRIPKVEGFVAALGEEAQENYTALLDIGEGGSGAFYRQLKHARNKSFHYQQLFLGDHEEQEPLKKAMAAHAEEEREKNIKQGEISDVPPALTGFLATFAYDVASEMVLPEETENEYPAFMRSTGQHIGRFLSFTKDALNAYTQSTRPEIWEVEAVPVDSGFPELLGALQTLVGEEVNGQMSVDDRFFGLGFSARLERVETLPESESIRFLFSNDLAFDLAPGEQTVMHGGPGLELRLPLGATLALVAENPGLEQGS